MWTGTESTYWKGRTMRLRAIKRYVDKYTKEMIFEGTIIEADETRARELIDSGACVSCPLSGGRKRTGRQNETATAAGDGTSTGLTNQNNENGADTNDVTGEGVEK